MSSIHPYFLRTILFTLLSTVSRMVFASSVPGVTAGENSTGNPSPILETTAPVSANNPFSVNFTIGFPASITEKKKTATPSLPSDTASFSTKASSSGKTRVYEYGTNPELGMNPAWHHTTAALRQAMNLGVDMVYIHLSAFADFNVAATDISEKLTELNKPMTVFLDNGTNASGAIISLQPDSSRSNSRTNQVKTAVYQLKGNQFQEKYKSYVNNFMNRSASAKSETEQKNLPVANIFSTHTLTNTSEKPAPSPQTSNLVVFKYTPSSYESLLDFLLSPVVSYVLLLIIMLGFLLEMRTPGTGFPLFAAIGASVLLIIPLQAEGLADYFEISLFSAGVLTVFVQHTWFRKQKRMFAIGAGIAFIGMLGCLLHPLSPLLFSSGLWSNFFKPILLLSAATGTVLILCFLFPGLRPGYRPSESSGEGLQARTSFHPELSRS